ncbi:MAG: hypothetical protein BMS9Abin05_2687 [Rhodothermia bacterium]|nr:MAG: hypothetical protein BMS9Abin05_2687 [Rhodothermia bacterium]
MAVLVDFTGSARAWAVDLVQPEDLTPIIRYLDLYGGELAVGEIGTDSKTPLKRLRLAPPRPAPILEEPNGAPNPFSRRKALRQYRKRLPELQAEYEAIEKARRDTNRVKIARFEADVKSFLAGDPNLPVTDLWSAISRATGFLVEDPLYWTTTSGKVPSRHIVISSDGRHNVLTSSFAKIHKSISIAVVSGTAGLGDFSRYGKRVRHFESSEAAISYTLANAMRGQN